MEYINEMEQIVDKQNKIIKSLKIEIKELHLIIKKLREEIKELNEIIDYERD